MILITNNLIKEPFRPSPHKGTSTVGNANLKESNTPLDSIFYAESCDVNIFPGVYYKILRFLTFLQVVFHDPL